MRESRLSQYKQNKLIEIFLASVTALAAAKLVNINKLQLITFIVYHCLSLKAAYIWKCLKVKFKRMKAILVVLWKVNLVKEKLEKLRNLFFETKWQSNTVVVMNMQSATLLPIIREKVNKVVLFIWISTEVMIFLSYI